MKKIKKNRKIGLIIIVAVALVAVGSYALFHHGPKPVSGSQYTKGEVTGTGSADNAASANSASDGTNAAGSQPGDQKSASNGDTGVAPTAPTGDFVSAHGDTAHPIVPGTALSSVCNTIPGASCQIVFTQDGTTHTLDAETTDRGGAAYWNSWTPQSIGLTSGSWQVKAVATANGQTASAADALKLVVSQ
jgi:hypothetical protein